MAEPDTKADTRLYACNAFQFAEICREIDYHSKKGKWAELLEITLKGVVGRIGIEPITY
ncbi:MAG: hypothetical protein JRJ74_14280 [Deltaproteobacteria bacterium]|nr:hypothetical protein [Deltaproteobacteria bacterium]